MRLSTLARIALLTIPVAASAQKGVMIEVRPTFAVPVGKLAGASLDMGPAFGVTASSRVWEDLYLYAGWDWAHFWAKDSFAGTKLDFEETGYTLGARFERPCPRGHPVALRLEGGATYKHVEIQNASGDLVADSKHSLGFEGAGGVAFSLSDDWKLIPMFRYRSLSPEFTVGATKTSGDLRYIGLEFTLSRRFR
jgi:opacity protein-like surface antigen